MNEYMGEAPGKMGNSGGGLDFQLIWHLQQRTIPLWRNDKTKESSFRVPREGTKADE